MHAAAFASPFNPAIHKATGAQAPKSSLTTNTKGGNQ
jgi:hypothetical protein